MVNSTALPFHAAPSGGKTARLWGMLSAISTPMIPDTSKIFPFGSGPEPTSQSLVPDISCEAKLRSQLNAALRDLEQLRVDHDGLANENAQLRSQMLHMSQAPCQVSISPTTEPPSNPMLESTEVETAAPAARSGTRSSGASSESGISDWAKSLASARKKERRRGVGGGGEEPALPEGWAVHVSQHSHPGERFYVNSYTGDATWDVPSQHALCKTEPAVQRWAATYVQRMWRGTVSRRRLETRLLSEIKHMENVMHQ